MAAQKILLQRFRTRLLSRSRIAEGTMFLQTGPEEYPEKGWKKQTRISGLISTDRNGSLQQRMERRNRASSLKRCWPGI
jgi:hypothetical protein